MKLLLVDNAYLYVDKQGNYYSKGIYDNSFFERYNSVFGEILFLAKVKEAKTDKELSGCTRIDDGRIEVSKLPDFHGIKGLIKELLGVLIAIRKAVKRSDCLVLRVLQLESIIAFYSHGHRPYLVEAVNNPVGDLRFNGFIKSILVKINRKIINEATGVSYVTERTLQQLFPYCRKDGIKTSYSSVELPDEYIKEPKIYLKQLNTIKISNVTNAIVGNTKGHYTIVNVAKMLSREGIRLECYFYGGGESIDDISIYAEKLGVSDRVFFCGYIADKKKLLNKIRESDIYIFPSETEGMPRSLIEACAVGLPCIASNVGGIPEIIDEKYLFPYGADELYAIELKRLAQMPEELTTMSSNNIKKAHRYQKSVLDKKRKAFYTSFFDRIKDE